MVASVAAKAFPGINEAFKIDHIISSTSVSASTQTKLTHLLEKETDIWEVPPPLPLPMHVHIAS